MFRNSVLYHRLWYVRKRNGRRARILFRITVIFIILALFASYTNKRLIPYLIELSEFKAESIIAAVVSRTVDEVFSDNLRYEDIVILSRDGSGNIVSVETDVIKLNKLSSRISQDIQEKLSGISRSKISIPPGALLGIPVLAGAGPELHVDVQPWGSVETDFKSEFTGEGINQTRHRIYLLVKTKVSIAVPMLSKKSEVSASIPVAETVIVGNVPYTYIKASE